MTVGGCILHSSSAFVRDPNTETSTDIQHNRFLGGPAARSTSLTPTPIWPEAEAPSRSPTHPSSSGCDTIAPPPFSYFSKTRHQYTSSLRIIVTSLRGTAVALSFSLTPNYLADDGVEAWGGAEVVRTARASLAWL